jgi:hypothetical protein
MRSLVVCAVSKFSRAKMTVWILIPYQVTKKPAVGS